MKVVFLDAGTLPSPLYFPDDSIQYQAFPSTAPEQVIERISGATVVITNKVRLNAAHLESSPQLKLVAVAAAGTDNIDLVTAVKLGIRVQNVPDYGSDSVAEHVIATLFALRRHIITYAAAAIDGRWSGAPQFCWNGPRIRDLGGSVLGVVGRGRIGQATARLAMGLGMQVLYAQAPGSTQRDDELPLDNLLAVADALTLHVPLTDLTRGLIGQSALEKMKPDAILINTGRGALVDPLALASALRNQTIGGAAIDVLEVEPPPHDHPLLAADIPNLLCTPHVAWASQRAQARLAATLVQLVLEQRRVS
ncbi:glycerate dehydrogenase [Undibacterium sp. KW1]|uniref:D-2-hydroxyacid dehydrogenase n=1 Tax=Undibacterium sp. KW1 TaxID=2058624 RepID=UPI001331EE85|nr:D-2-hydroxyacid dehydrogenase [Undibacterium sp. KW1]BBB62409.1 glycerate dehydrogenase [Undibacterium sp. KW1]